MKQLNIFVAMPGTTMGDDATYKNPEAVKANLLQPVVERLKNVLQREVRLTIEKDKKTAGVIHESMFAEARDADVYIADLSGANPNVYLELGVRWALRDGVTILICQNVADLRFNVGANRAIIYNPDRIVQAADDIVQAIVSGLTSDKTDSPVRLNTSLVTVDTREIERLNEQISALTSARGDDLLRAGLATPNLKDRLAHLKEANRANPASTDVLLELGKTERVLSDYAAAIEAFRAAIRLNPDKAVLHRELGVTLSKAKLVSEAIASLHEAVRLAPTDAEAWSNLGGAQRRMGMSGAPANIDVDSLLKSRESYSQAHSLNKYDLYSGLNVCRLDLLLSKWHPEKQLEAKNGFTKQIHLSRFAVEEDPKDYWRRFDLVDTLLFSDQHDEALVACDEAIALVPAEERKDVLPSVIGPLESFVTAGVLENSTKAVTELIIGKLREAVTSTA
jgi:tetratricopeptide (TPR) repeat protein